MPKSMSFDPNQHIANALAEYDAQIAQLQKRRAQLAAIIGGGSASVSAKPAKAKAAAPAAGGAKPKRKMSAAARKKISDAQKARWAAQKKGGK